MKIVKIEQNVKKNVKNDKKATKNKLTTCGANHWSRQRE